MLDLQDKNGERKFMKTKADLYANTFLTEKSAYTLVVVRKGENEEELVEPVVIDGACIRTLDEDAKAKDEEVEPNDPKKAAAAAKGGKKK